MNSSQSKPSKTPLESFLRAFEGRKACFASEGKDKPSKTPLESFLRAFEKFS
jgi:hypothetical protein